MGPQLVDVEDPQAVGGEDPLGRHQREVGEVLVIDGVELVLFDELLQVGELDGDDALGPSRVVMPATKLFRSGTWARTLLPMIRSAMVPSPASFDASSAPKNSVSVGMPLSTATSATLRAGSMPSTGMPFATNHWSR